MLMLRNLYLETGRRLATISLEGEWGTRTEINSCIIGKKI